MKGGECIRPVFFLLDSFQQLFRFLWIVPEIRGMRFFFFLLDGL
jgi:hypothetical protein